MRNGVLPLFLIFSFSQILVLSCSVELPPYVISESKMERILYDYHLAQGMAEAEGGDVEQNRYLYVQKVFEKHHITEAQFDTSMVWYSGNASHLEEIYKHIEARLERESNAAGLNIPEEDKYARFTAEGDTANIWQGKDMFFLHGNREENLYTLIIPADSTFHRGDYFMLRFGNRFITQDGQRESFVLMQVRYDNDSVVGATSMVASDHDVTLNITKEMVLPEHAIKSLSCTFYYAFNEQDEDKFRLWVISKPVLLRYHSPIEEQTDSTTMLADSLRSDTLQTDTTNRDANGVSRGIRMSPTELRESQPVERKINVVEKRKVKPSTQQQRIKRSR